MQTPAAGVGVFLSEGAAEKKLRRSWWQWWKSWIAALPDTVLAFVPFESIVCTRTVTADPKLGRLYSTLLETGNFTFPCLMHDKVLTPPHASSRTNRHAKLLVPTLRSLPPTE